VVVAGRKIDTPCAAVDYGETLFALYRHPQLLIPRSIMVWEKEYRYAGDNYSIVPYMDRHPAAIELAEIYKREMNRK
jgi:hypothetical protein